MDTIMGLYVTLLIIGLILFLYLKNRNLKKKLSLKETEKEFFRELLNVYMEQYGEDLFNERVKDFIKRLGITAENPLIVRVNKNDLK